MRINVHMRSFTQLQCVLDFVWLLLTMIPAVHWAQRILEDMFLDSTVQRVTQAFTNERQVC